MSFIKGYYTKILSLGTSYIVLVLQPMEIYQVHEIVIMIIIIVIMHDYIYSLLFHHYCDYNVDYDCLLLCL